ncbi:MAG TPA: acetyl-CoA carboxylase biotin carboxylase subunit [Burkholderiales bacterium]
MFGKLLIANRGEIACRVMRTARRLGIRTVAVYSDADREARHVRLADEAHRVGPPPAIDSYLDGQAILAAARASGAEAIHPGYGFLSENEHFAAACRRSGIVFVGPSAEAIAAMGDKSAAKRLMEKAGVPLVPGYHGEEQDTTLLQKEAQRIGYPVLIKPSAGGGGKGMRIVHQPSEFEPALEAARREARAAFSDERVLVERYLERPRHVEIQVLGDTQGKVLHLFERDCSVQRRHQKVIEEAPAPNFTKRNEMGAAAVAAARAIAYTGAGTVEFIVDAEGRFYFMEMNTRLQVEHPVTEMVTGLDLVELQLRVAAGEPLPFDQETLAVRGHAIEARVYAEDPARDFLPSTGRLVHVAFPDNARVETGVEAGAEISSWYDPMIAKIIVHGETRADALARMKAALRDTRIAGVATNVEFLRRICENGAFSAGEVDTGLIERHREQLVPPRAGVPAEVLASAAWAELAAEETAARELAHRSGDPHSPWHRVDGWRMNEASHHDFIFLSGAREHLVRVVFNGARTLEIDGRAYDVPVVKAQAIADGPRWHVFHDGGCWTLELKDELPSVDADTAGSLAAPMPGRVIKLMVQPGARVAKGEPLLILEAMKMEHTITAPMDGTVMELHYVEGDQVLEGAALIRIE